MLWSVSFWMDAWRWVHQNGPQSQSSFFETRRKILTLNHSVKGRYYEYSRRARSRSRQGGKSKNRGFLDPRIVYQSLARFRKTEEPWKMSVVNKMFYTPPHQSLSLSTTGFISRRQWFLCKCDSGEIYLSPEEEEEEARNKSRLNPSFLCSLKLRC